MASTQASRSIFNTFDIDADYIDFNGKPGSNDDVHLTAHDGSKFILESDTQVPEGKKFLVSQVCDKNGTEIFSKDETNNRIKFNIPIDLNNNALVNNPGGGGGSGPTTTSAISSENLSGQTLEDELDALTAQQTTNTNSIGTLNTNVATNTTAIGNNTTNITTNTNALTAMNLQQQTNTLAITANSGAITGLQTTQGTNSTAITSLQATATAHSSDIATLQGNDTTQDTNITNLQTAAATALTDITNLQTTQATQGTDITNLQTTQGTQGNSITALTTQQNLNTAAIASNTARTSNLTADRILISSATGTINTAGIGVADVATKNSSNTFNAPLGNPATQNSFDTITASTITNTGATESASYTQGSAPLNFSHLAGSATTAQLPVQSVRTDLPDQTIQGNASSSSLTKITLDNTHATGTSNFVLQKRSTGGVLEGGLTIQQTTTGTNITGQAPAGQTPDISITPANGSLAMTIGGLESRFHNNLKIIGSMSGAARSDNKDYIFRTIGSTGTGDVLLMEDVLQRPTTGVPAAGFNPTNNSLIEFNSSGVPSYKETSNFLSKPSNANPSVRSFVAVETGGTFSYVPSTFLPLPGGLLPTSGENIIFVNPGGPSAYVDRANIIERPGAANPTSGTKLITINNVGTRAYKDLGQFLTTPGNANPSADSFIKISSTGVQSYVAESSLGGGLPIPGGANPGQQSLVSVDTAGTTTYSAESNFVKKDQANQVINQPAAANSFTISCDSATNSDNASLKILRSFSGVESNSIEFIPKPGSNTEWRCKNDLDIYINNSHKFRIGNHTSHVYHPFQFEDDARLKHGQTIPTQSAFTGVAGTIRFDDNYLYVCRSNGNWKRVALSTF